jgi:hypothetical protein
MNQQELNLLILIVGVLIFALILAGPTLYQDYKKRHDKRS